MKNMLRAGLVATGLLLTTLSASAAPTMNGVVTATNGQGAYIANNNGVTFVPFRQAKFRVNGQPVSDRRISNGMRVSVYPQNNYNIQYVPQAYYNSHQNWDWNRNVSGWNNDRSHWKQDRNGWHRY